MPALRDATCSHCGAHRSDVWFKSLAQLAKRRTCEACGKRTTFRADVNSGLKARWRFADWPSDPTFYDGQITSVPPKAYVGHEDHGEHSINSQTGNPIHEDMSYQDAEARDERADKRKHKLKRAMGKTPIVIDQTKG